MSFWACAERITRIEFRVFSKVWKRTSPLPPLCPLSQAHLSGSRAPYHKLQEPELRQDVFFFTTSKTKRNPGGFNTTTRHVLVKCSRFASWVQGKRAPAQPFPACLGPQTRSRSRDRHRWSAVVQLFRT